MPDGLPRLTAGAHLVPEDGACLMEYASVLAGEPFSDHPRCTDPLLATLARLVNDATTDAGRHRLAPLAPALAAALPGTAVGAASLVHAVLESARDRGTRSRALDRQLRAARRRLRRVTGTGVVGRVSRWLEPAHRRGPAPRRLAVAVAALGPARDADRDGLLRGLLTDALRVHAAGAAGAAGSAGEPCDRVLGPYRPQDRVPRG